jgi:hypothetical protein
MIGITQMALGHLRHFFHQPWPTSALSPISNRRATGKNQYHGCIILDFPRGID